MLVLGALSEVLTTICMSPSCSLLAPWDCIAAAVRPDGPSCRELSGFSHILPCSVQQPCLWKILSTSSFLLLPSTFAQVHLTQQSTIQDLGPAG